MVAVYDKSRRRLVLDVPEKLGTRLVGTAEVAAMLDVERPRIAKLMRLGDFPAPFAVLASGPVWWDETIREEVRAKPKRYPRFEFGRRTGR